MDLLAHWQAISVEENDRIEAALLEHLDEDDAMTALQVLMKHTVPASQLRGAVLTPEIAAIAATLVDLAKRSLPPHISEAQQVEAYLALKRIAGGSRPVANIERPSIAGQGQGQDWREYADALDAEYDNLRGHRDRLWKERDDAREQLRGAVGLLRLVRVEDADFEGDDDLHVGVLLTREQAAAIRLLLDGGR